MESVNGLELMFESMYNLKVLNMRWDLNYFANNNSISSETSGKLKNVLNKTSLANVEEVSLNLGYHFFKYKFKYNLF